MNWLEKAFAVTVLGMASLFSNIDRVKAEIHQVPVDSTVNLQTDYLDSGIVKDGDTLDFYQGDKTFFQGDFTTDKSITIRGNDCGILGNFEVRGNASLNLENIFIKNGGGNAVNINDSASLYAVNSEFASIGNSIYFNSTGNLNINLSIFPEPQRLSNTSISLEKLVGDINITQTFMGGGGIGINIKSDEKGDEKNPPTLNILNNTIVYRGRDAVRLNSLLTKTTGTIANNNLTDSAVGIRNSEYAGLVIIEKNNLYNNTDDYAADPVALSGLFSQQHTGSPSSANLHLNPSYTEDGTYRLKSDSPLWHKGLYIAGVTTWFPSASETWIGYSGDGIPEPGTLALLALGGLGLFVRNRRKEGRNYAESEVIA